MSTLSVVSVLSSSSTSSPSSSCSSAQCSHISSSLPSTQSVWPSHLCSQDTHCWPKSHVKLVSSGQGASEPGVLGSEGEHRFSSVPSSQSWLPSQTLAIRLD